MSSEPSDVAAFAAPREPSRLAQCVELLVLLFLIGPSMVLALFTIRAGQEQFPLVAAVTIFRDLALVALILYFLWRNGEPFARIGWTARHLPRELLIGLALFPAFCVSAALLEMLLIRLGLSSGGKESFLHIQGPLDTALGLALVIVVAIAEETIFRGYLLLRLPALVYSRAAAVVLSALIFATGHGYEGSAGLITVAFMGLWLALVYVWRGSLAAPMLMHFLQDFLSIVLLPVFGFK